MPTQTAPAPSPAKLLPPSPYPDRATQISDEARQALQQRINAAIHRLMA
jgi:hypothetical protein